ncbi:MAG: putative manganese transporter [Moritella sp.]|uniref:putative manganese transporter n=1 Tax=Moritella sp. TaxID=78556 RepID=UPI0029A78789|nr:putative manganese transporter [Moritella sp.]MDX2320145.1 putative manganese transporter [Moritella sp.]
MLNALSIQVNAVTSSSKWQLLNKRLLLPVTMMILIWMADTQTLTIQVLADAFWQVAAYVAATLAIYYGISAKLSKHNALSNLIRSNSRYQVLFAAAMGALPGCGGAIVIITQYVSGRVSFGAVVAVLTATMGDAAFLLLAAQPMTGLFIITIGCIVGLITGLIIDAIHGPDFLRPKLAKQLLAQGVEQGAVQDDSKPVSALGLKLQGLFWQWLIIPASIIAVMGSLQIDIDALFSITAGSVNLLGAFLVLIAMLLWAMSREVTDYESAVSEDPKTNINNLFQRIAQDTNFVTSWVIGAFLLFELTMHWTGLDLAIIFQNWMIFVPLLAVMIGLLPGCGPQILVTGLYLSGSIPLSAQLGNALSNDGDALFPAIALAPKAAFVATLYSTLPALFAAYSYYYLFE